MFIVTARTNWFVCERYSLKTDGNMSLMYLSESSQEYYDVVLPMSEVLQIRQITNHRLFELLKKIKSVHCLYIVVSDEAKIATKDYVPLFKTLSALLPTTQSRLEKTFVRMSFCGGNSLLMVSKGDNFSEYALPEQVIKLNDLSFLIDNKETNDGNKQC